MSFIKHGMANTRFYSIYHNINNRCNNKHDDSFKNYGNIGIKNTWKSFEEFKKDMYTSYLYHVKKYGEKETQIDRINSKKNYCKLNCRWATLVEQARTRSTTKKITIRNKTKSLREWSRIYNIPYKKLVYRISIGWDIKTALYFFKK